MPLTKILVVTDAPFHYEEALHRKGCILHHTASLNEVKSSFDLVLADHSLVDEESLRAFLSSHPRTLTILLTTYAKASQAVAALKWGVFNYLFDPFSLETFEAMFAKAEDHLRLLEENHSLRHAIAAPENHKLDQLVVASPSMKKILKDVASIAKSHASVFVCGESGTGKEMIAAALHAQSPRAHYPFIRVNCAAIPATLLESEFFGHEKGSFTGATQRRLGRFELAHLGTLLLDEISEIPLELQAKLLRAVQEMEFERVGGSQSIRVDVRFVSTSNRSMKEAIEQKLFREDLYYRLNVVPIHLPPLRERKEDILHLTEHFLKHFAQRSHVLCKTLTQEAADALVAYPWPGNIRELANVIERTLIIHSSHNIISLEHLGLEFSCPVPSVSPFPEGLTLHEMEKRLILQTLTTCAHNRTKTADQLGISVRTLRNKLKEYQS